MVIGFWLLFLTLVQVIKYNGGICVVLFFSGPRWILTDLILKNKDNLIRYFVALVLKKPATFHPNKHVYPTDL